MVRPAALIIFASLALASCGKDEVGCTSGCGTLRDKRIDFNHSSGENVYRYIVDTECEGVRVTYSGRNGTAYSRFLIGDRVCTTEI